MKHNSIYYLLPNWAHTFLPNWLGKLSNADIIALSSLITAILSFAVALTSLGITLWQAYLIRKHNRISVRPHIDWMKNTYPLKPVELIMVNRGLGPAILEDFITIFDGISYQTNLLPKKLHEEIIKLDLHTQNVSFDKETPINTGNEIILIKFNDLTTVEKYNAAIYLLSRLKFKCVYRSFHNEKFEATSP